ncbi:MAG TPA: tetratricopeptide repeat protein [Pyrinomonadaceae bacterium]|nr:tetratricopeptide repeat protein [Pyrinomonadaceae bacterium]
MTDWLKLVGMIFYAPLRGMREVRDQGSLGPAVLCAYLSQVAYIFVTQWLAGDRALLTRGPLIIGGAFFQGVAPILTIAIVFVPLLALTTNLFDRRGSFSVVLQQEYGSLAAVAFYVFTAASLVTILITAFFHFSGIQAAYVASAAQSQGAEQLQTMAQWFRLSAEEVAQLKTQLADPVVVSRNLFNTVRLALFTIGGAATVRVVFRVPVLRAIAVFLLTSLTSLPLSFVLYPMFRTVVGSPFLLLFAFFLLRGYFASIVSTQRARASFKQNLEAATINPRDSSAHYNLGLIHQQRGELDQARERFHRAIDIDPEELDAHYQLGRIARAQNRLPDAVGHFEQVVQRDQAHALHEIWREIGATYNAAGQYSDARSALERFLDRRPNDPEGLYLIGRAHAGMGDQQEATSSMQACIEAVKTAPAYKYRTEKRWLNEAQQFLKGRKQEAVGGRQ